MNVSKTTEYQSWHSMLRRVTWPCHKDYPGYGGRGIKIAPEWLTFANFLQDMGPKPAGTSLERKDNNGDYCKDNCIWASFQSQNFNRRPHKNKNVQLVGVCLVNRGKAYRAYGKLNGITTELYRGPDFWLAACARKSWEARCVR